MAEATEEAVVTTAVEVDTAVAKEVRNIDFLRASLYIVDTCRLRRWSWWYAFSACLTNSLELS